MTPIGALRHENGSTGVGEVWLEASSRVKLVLKTIGAVPSGRVTQDFKIGFSIIFCYDGLIKFSSGYCTNPEYQSAQGGCGHENFS